MYNKAMDAANTTAPRYRYHGTNDEADTCSCCGRKNLKRVAWLSEIDGDGEAAPYGTTCAALMLCGRKINRSEAVKVIDAAQQLELDAIIARWRARPAMWPVERRANRYGVDCFVINGQEIVAVQGLNDHDALADAMREFRAGCATREARLTLKGWTGRIDRSAFK